MVWAGDRNYFTCGETAYPEDHTVLETKEPVAYNRCDESCWHSGGGVPLVPEDGVFHLTKVSVCMHLQILATKHVSHAGTWLMAVYPVEGRSTLVGFLHGEDHFRVSINRCRHFIPLLRCLYRFLPISRNLLHAENCLSTSLDDLCITGMRVLK